MKAGGSVFMVVAAVAVAPVYAQVSTPSASASASQPTANTTTSTSATNPNTWNPSASNNPGTNPLIPNTISSNCQAFLAKLNAAPEVSTCTSQLITATSAFSNGKAGSGQADIDAALTQMCSDSTSCPTILLRNVLTHFAGNCSTELEQGEPVVQSNYDALYIIDPFKAAICTKDYATGGYCYETIVSASHKASASSTTPDQNATVSTSDTSILANKTSLVVQAPGYDSTFSGMLSSVSSYLVTNGATSLRRRASSLLTRQSTTTNTNTNTNTTSTTASSSVNNNVQPNSTTFLSTNLPFLFLQPTLPAFALCTACTQDVMAAYVAFEMAMPYAPGLNSSGLLAGQLELWNSMNTHCGVDFTNVIQTKAGIVVAATLKSGAVSLKVMHWWTSIGCWMLASLVFWYWT